MIFAHFLEAFFDKLIDLMENDPANFRPKRILDAQETWKRYCSTFRNPDVRWSDVDCYLIAAYLLKAIENGCREDCNITYLYEIHQLQSSL